MPDHPTASEMCPACRQGRHHLCHDRPADLVDGPTDDTGSCRCPYHEPADDRLPL